MIKRFVLVLLAAGGIVLVQLGCNGGGDNVPKLAGDSPATSVHLKVQTPSGGGGPAPKPQ